VPTLEQLGRRLGNGGPRRAMDWCARLGVQVRPDWSGAPAVGDDAAAKIVDEYDRSHDEHDDRDRAYQQYLAARVAARQAAADQAWNDAYEKAATGDRKAFATMATDEYAYMGTPTGQPTPSPVVVETARQAAAKAADTWDRKHPERSFEEFVRKGPNL
jgi:hypothetical protein